MSTLLKLEGLAAGYGARTVVQHVDLEVKSGEFCALLGLNGSGKTTLLRAVGGLLSLREGRCLVEGVDCAPLSPRERARRFSYVPQRHSPLAGVTAEEAVLMGRNPYLGLLSSPSPADRAAAYNALAQVGGEALAGCDFAQLSQGQRQLVVLARALVQDAPVMLLDEPDSALDFLNRHRALALIRDLLGRHGKGGLISLHDPNFALAYCHRLFLLREGTVAGALDLRSAGAAEVRECLSLLYGPVTVLEHQGRLIML
jgi:iron complex transport system ATP-binding protein